MNKIINFFLKNKAIIVIMLLASMLRLSGIKYSYPPYHADEGMSYSQGISIIKEKTLDAHGYSLAYAYPTVVPIVNAFFFKFVFIPLKWVNYWIVNLNKVFDGFIKIPLNKLDYDRIFQLEILGARDINVLKWGRIISAFFGIGVVLLSYLLSKDVFNKKTGLIVAFLVAINYRHVLNSHINLPDIYNSFFLILSIIFSYRIFKKPNKINYLLAGVFIGISFSVKFHIYSFFPLIFIHFFSIKKLSFNNFIKDFIFNKNIYLSFLIAAFVVLIINPYHVINIGDTLSQLSDVAGKYRTGRFQLDFYPYSYLYHIGIGKLAFILSGIGIFFALLKKFKQSIIILSATAAFFFIMTYYTGGGFYTRNFVTIIPLVLTFTGYLLASILDIKPKIISLPIFFIIMFFITKESLNNSIIVAKEYKSIWNVEVLSSWISNNIPEGSVMAAHSSVPLPVKDVKVLPYNFDDGPFSIEEFKNLGADFIVINFDWATVNFYEWMTQNTVNSFKYWNKPLDFLENTFAGMAIREISDYAIYWVIKPWQAPDSNFLVAKVPDYKIKDKKLFSKFDFPIPLDIWKSDPVNVSNWNGYVINYETFGDGKEYVYLNFYKEISDVGNVRKRIAVRLSARDNNKTMVGTIPKDSKYMTLGFESYNPYKGVDYIKELILYNADVDIDFSGFDVKRTILEDGIIFPNSHGNL